MGCKRGMNGKFAGRIVCQGCGISTARATHEGATAAGAVPRGRSRGRRSVSNSPGPAAAEKPKARKQGHAPPANRESSKQLVSGKPKPKASDSPKPKAAYLEKRDGDGDAQIEVDAQSLTGEQALGTLIKALDKIAKSLGEKDELIAERVKQARQRRDAERPLSQ